MLSTGVGAEVRTSAKKKCPSRGKRYSKSQKEEILKYAKDNSVEDAADKFNVTGSSIYEWRRAMKRRGDNGGAAEVEAKDPAEYRNRKIINMWRQHPGYGPSQVRNMLKRSGFKVSVGTVRHVMEENGYLPPTLKRKEHVGRYEAGRPRELYHLDFYHFYVHKQKQCVLFIEDDYSRFIAGWAMAPTEKADPVIESFDLAVQRYGRPDGVMTDRGSAFHSWKGLSRFEALMGDYENQLLPCQRGRG